MLKELVVWKFDDVLPLLEKIDCGYAPNEAELSKLSSITVLQGPISSDIHSLPKSISLLENLQELDLSWTSIQDLSFLSNLTNLKELDLCGLPIDNIAILTNLSKLERLELDDTPVENIEALAHLKNLEYLDLSDSKVADLSSLAELTNLQILDLSNTPITNINALAQLQNLETLDLSNTVISNIDALENMINLDVLHLDRTRISDISVLSRLVNLSDLRLGFTRVSDISSLSDLTNLVTLDLQYTQVENLYALAHLKELEKLQVEGTPVTNVDSLKGLNNLEILNLNRSAIININGLTELPNLRELFLGGTQVSNIECLGGLNRLTGLALWKTKITSVDSLSNLVTLKTLALQGTDITSIDCLFPLVNLEVLYLADTKISGLPRWIGNLSKLKRLDISNLNLHSLPKELLQLNLPFTKKGNRAHDNWISIDGTVLATQPLSIFEQPRELIWAYYDAEQIPINEAKVIFLGDGGAGKTHTIQRIQNNGKQAQYETETTPGIEITNYLVDRENQKFNIHFWDFGGQEIMHAMHRCFLTDRTCYVVVVSNRWDLNSRARYWLKNIDSFAKGAPVLLAINRWDNIQETGIDMSRLTKDYPNLVKQPVYYSAKNSNDVEFQQLIDAIIREAGKLDSSAMSFPVQWASIRQQLLDLADKRHYIDKNEYHQICDQQELDSPQIRAWLLEWFNDLGVCFSYHQNESKNTELESYKVLNPRWLTNAIYIIINAGQRYADKGRMGINLIQDLLGHSEFGVLPNVRYTDSEREYILEVMRKFNLSYSVSNTQEFIPALCDSETPPELHPTLYTRQLSYQLVYPYLPDSVVHQLMIRSYKSLNPEKIWRKGLRIDIEWLGLTAVVDMGNDDATLRIDVYANGNVEPWELLHSIRKDIAIINSKLGLDAKDYIVIHSNGGDIPITVNQLLDAKDQGMNTLPIYNEFSRIWEYHQVDELLGATFGEEIIAATMKESKEKEQSFAETFPSITIENINIYQQAMLPDALKIIEYLIQRQCETNTQLMECLVNALESTKDEEAEMLAKNVKQDHKEKKNFLKRIEEQIKPAATIVSSGTTIYKGGKAIVGAIQAAYPQIIEHLPEIAEFFQNLPPIA